MSPVLDFNDPNFLRDEFSILPPFRYLSSNDETFASLRCFSCVRIKITHSSLHCGDGGGGKDGRERVGDEEERDEEYFMRVVFEASVMKTEEDYVMAVGNISAVFLSRLKGVFSN